MFAFMGTDGARDEWLGARPQALHLSKRALCSRQESFQLIALGLELAHVTQLSLNLAQAGLGGFHDIERLNRC